VSLDVADAFPDAITLVLGDCRQDRKYELADPVAGDVAAQIDHVQTDALILHLLQRAERIGCGAEGAIEVGCDDDVALLDGLEKPLAFRSFRQRDRITGADEDFLNSRLSFSCVLTIEAAFKAHNSGTSLARLCLLMRANSSSV
jgi:hypothetical protein